MTHAQRNLYEGMFIISASLSDDARTKALDRIKQAIAERGGEVKKIHEQGRRKLAYEINRHREGYYYVVYFDLPTTSMNDFWQACHLNEDLIRFVTLAAESVVEKIEFPSLAQAQ